MLRLIGILTGSALAVAVLIVALGPPRFSPPGDTAGTPAAENLATAVPVPVVAKPVAVEPAAPSDEPPADTPTSAPLADAETEALIEEIFAPQPAPIETPADSPADPLAAGDNWYAFWSPFRSEIAANGFIARLQETTGIDYRVVKVKTGVYEVAFAYVDDNDIQEKLERISAATGLDVTGS